jgi:hypothetical protein
MRSMNSRPLHGSLLGLLCLFLSLGTNADAGKSRHYEVRNGEYEVLNPSPTSADHVRVSNAVFDRFHLELYKEGQRTGDYWLERLGSDEVYGDPKNPKLLRGIFEQDKLHFLIDGGNMTIHRYYQ